MTGLADVRQELRTLVERFGPGVLEDAEGLRSLLDDVLEEDATPTETNLLVDAVRYAAVERLRNLIAHGAAPHAAVSSASGFLAAQRGGTDERSAAWACEAIGYALGIVPDRRGEVAAEDIEPPASVDTVPVDGPGPGRHDADPATRAVSITQRPPEQDRRPPQEWARDSSPRDAGSAESGPPGRRRWWPLVLGAGLVGAVVVVATVLVWVRGEDPAPTSRSASEVARGYAALGSTLTRGVTDPCAVVDPGAGETGALSCDYGELTLDLATYEDATALDAHRHEVEHDRSRPDDLLVEDAAGDYLERALPDGGRLLYWDSTDALQSATVETDGRRPSRQRLRTWFDHRGVSHLDRTPGPPPESAPPKPFESAALYEFARHLFDAEECFVPEPGEFPVSEIVPDAEVVKCEQADMSYTGTFWCSFDTASFLADREEYLARAVDGTLRAVSGAPAGQRTPVDGIQVAFNHVDSFDARVYWDSPEQLCAGELQATDDDDVDATVDHWLAGADT